MAFISAAAIFAASGGRSGDCAGDIAIFKTADGALFALRDRCPHKGGPLSQGIVAGNGVTCPLHNWVISLETGEATGADHGCTPKIPLKVEGGRVLLSAGAVMALRD